jgi:hypothetical protein
MQHERIWVGVAPIITRSQSARQIWANLQENNNDRQNIRNRRSVIDSVFGGLYLGFLDRVLRRQGAEEVWTIMPRFKVCVTTDVEYIVEADNKDEAYEAVLVRDEYLDKRYVWEQITEIEEIDNATVQN